MSTYYNLASLFYEYLRKYRSPEVFEQLQTVIEPFVEQLKDLALTYQDIEAGTLASALAEEGYDILSPDEEMVSFSCPVFDLTAYAKDALVKFLGATAKVLFADDALYLIAYYYMSLESYKNANKYLEKLIGAFPNSSRTPWARKDIEIMKQKGLGAEAENETGTKKKSPK